jgi:integrase
MTVWPASGTRWAISVATVRSPGIDEDLRHPHVLRHTFATRYYRRTGRLAELQRLLGHCDPKTTMIYVDDDPRERERLMMLASDEPTTLDLDRAA